MMLGDGYERLSRARVAVFGIGGVGGYAVEALARAGVGSLVLVDSDTVSVSNINRQIIATADTVGKYKTEAARERILSINPDCKVEAHTAFFTKENKSEFDFSSYDYVIDAIDSLSSKFELITTAKAADVKIISAMGAGNKLDPTRFKVADISKTAVCPLARAVRVELRKRGINHLKVVYSDEPPFVTQSARNAEATSHPLTADIDNKLTITSLYSKNAEISDTFSAETSKNQDTGSDLARNINKAPQAIEAVDATKEAAKPSDEKGKYDSRRAPGSISFVPSVMGLILAGEVIKDIAFS